MARVIEVPVMLVLAGRPQGEWLGHFPSASTVRVSPLGRGDVLGDDSLDGLVDRRVVEDHVRCLAAELQRDPLA